MVYLPHNCTICMSVHKELVSLQHIYTSGACIRYTYDTLVHLQQIRILGGSTTDNRRLQQILVSQQHILVESAADNQRLQQTRTSEPATVTGMVSLQRIPVSVQQALASRQQLRTQVSLQQIPLGMQRL